MKKDKNISNAYTQALSRVKSLFSKESKETPADPKKSLEKGQGHAYDYLKLPRMLGAKQRLIQGNKKEKQDWSKKLITYTDVSHCSLSPKYLMHLLLELNSLQKKSLNAKKLYLKEHLLAKRNFQNMGKEMNEWMTSHLGNKIKVIPDEKPKKEDDVNWEDFIRHKEERQFVMTRVIKYLLD